MKIIMILILLSSLHVSSASGKQSYIVYMGAHSHGPQPTIEDFNRATDYHHNFLASYLGSVQEAKDAIFYSYTRHINGFAANLEEHQVSEIAKHPGVVSVFNNSAKQLHTSHSWEFMNLEVEGKPSESWYAGRFGEDTIIGNIDTGVWPESKSFSDDGYGPIPARWRGTCDEHVTDGHQIRCNRKLIGARHFNRGYKAAGGTLEKYMESARDYDGHGTHTLSTAGGNFVANADVGGLPIGTVKGGSPKARVASYKVCWPNIDVFTGGCYDSDTLAAFDMAIHDGVDVISVSLGANSQIDYFNDATAIGAFHAVQHGIVVVCSAGNSGFPNTVVNAAPWIITVGASTMDREFLAYVKLGNGHLLKGASLSQRLPENKLYPLISANQAQLANVSDDLGNRCFDGTLDPKKVSGKILVCRSGNGPLMAGVEAKLAGAVGIILCNHEYDGDQIDSEIHVLPAIHLNFNNGSTVLNYVENAKEPMGYIIGPTAVYDVKPAPSMDIYTSQGPNSITPEILKPDITAPGKKVIAAYSGYKSPSAIPEDTRNATYTSLSGTSMACPHISGIAGLLKTLYPSWSPAAIRSAIMTTATNKDNNGLPIMDIEYNGAFEATPFYYGAGHVRPTQVINPGLIYDTTPNDYLNFLCATGYNKTMIELFKSHKCSNTHSKRSAILDLNYPSITVANLSGSVTVTRTVKNVGTPGVYVSSIRQPAGVSVRVKPTSFRIKSGGVKKFEVTLKPEDGVKSGEYRFGDLVWSDGVHHVRSPIVVSVS